VRLRRHSASALILPLVAGVTSCVFGREPQLAPSVGVAAGWTIDSCAAAAVDRDRDGLDDVCELDLARAFAPMLVVDGRDCSWNGSRLAGGYFYAVQKGSDAGAIRIAYLPAYFRDCGWSGLACTTRRRGCSAHAGDSELIAVEARGDEVTDRWRADAIFMSAHCFGRSAGRCRWYAGDQLRHLAWAGTARGAPRVWVAKGKHGNYPSARECDSGHWYYDSCDDNDVAFRFPIVTSAQNIGSRVRPFRDGGLPRGCVAAEELPVPDSRADAGTRECFWDAAVRFRGWQRGSHQGATSYARVLAGARF
jgi:hypothetical protein